MAAPAPAAREPARAPVPAPAAPAPAPAGPAPAAAPGKLADALSRVVVAPDVPKEELALQGGAALAVPAPVGEYLDRKGAAGGPVRVRLGQVAAGTLHLHKTDQGIVTGPGSGFQSIPLLHPLLLPLRTEGIEPVLALRVHGGVLEGHASARVKGVLLDGPLALPGRMEASAKALGWHGVGGLRLPGVENELRGATLVVKAGGMSFTLGGFLSASGSLGLANELVTFDAVAKGTVAGLGSVEVPVVRGPDGALSGKAVVDVALRGFTGQVTAAFAAGLVDVRGTVRYANDKFDGQVTLVATDARTAKELTDSQLSEQVNSSKAVTGEAAAPDAAAAPAEPAGPRPGPRVVAGWGAVSVQLADWLRGEALVVVDHHGDVTVVGKILPKMDKPLFEQKKYLKQLAKFEVRALYGVPLVGNVFLFAGIGLEAEARVGPATLDRMELTGTWSTKPEVLKSFGLTGTLNISAYAGLRLKAEGGAGIQLLGHDIKAGIALIALAGVRGYVEATPVIGYREVADPKAGKHGEFFLAGHMEIAAQPFLGLGGELFVELDSPWWSPAPDKHWNWPLAQLEYPLPGEFGIGADVEHVLGSGKVPEITFGEVDFSADKFMTDLVGDHVPAKSAKDEQKKGAWKALGGPAAPAKAPAKAPVKPAAKAPPKAAAPTPAPARGKPATPEAAPPSPAVQHRWLAGLHALGALAERSHRDPQDAAELRDALAGIKKTHGFTALDAELVAGKWQVTAAMNPTTKKVPQIDADVGTAGPGRTAAAADPAPKTDEELTAYVRRLWNRIRQARLRQPVPSGGPIAQSLNETDRKVLRKVFPGVPQAGITLRDLAVYLHEAAEAAGAADSATALAKEQAEARERTASATVYSTLAGSKVPSAKEKVVNSRAKGLDEYALLPLAPAEISYDHVVSKKEFSGLPGVAELSHAERMAILHNEANVRLQKRGPNSSRGETPWPQAEWMHKWYDPAAMARAVRLYHEARTYVVGRIAAKAKGRT
ncbi:hypothetical protein [Streptomyces sp. NBC_01443]|uniref:hypothetical protein n=1 Tax=Streptomyces sp. NBC_01443 TaxID=2903868 RepID=UPI00224FA576|nr:hypothetical protein [Streptomyces sp. NBC_01443]MCX4626668.1 hypothetical protein [Streptomyces sp. NBC_01443]